MPTGGRRLHGQHVHPRVVGLRGLIGRGNRLGHKAIGLVQSGDHVARRYPEGERHHGHRVVEQQRDLLVEPVGVVDRFGRQG